MKPFPRLCPVKNVNLLRHKYGVTSCCMRRVNGFKGGLVNGKVDYGKACLPLSLVNDTAVPLKWEFIVIECEFIPTSQTSEFFVTTSKTQRRVDLHWFIQQDENANNKTKSEKVNNPLKPNVLLIVLDSVSRIHFRRVFPQVHNFLVENLTAVEFKGYHKTSSNTFPNIGSLLTGLKVAYKGSGLAYDTVLNCEGPNLTYDSCPFIWKEFKEAGYKTFYGEDNGLRDYFYRWRGGFNKRPTDYFVKPLTAAAAESIEHDEYGNITIYGKCYGPRSAFRVMMENLEKFLVKMDHTKDPYFAYSHSDTITHDYLNGGLQIAEELLESLKRFKIGGYLDNTFVILLADHGIRLGEMRNHIQGFLEDRLPFMYIAYPKLFPKIHPKAYENLVKNAEENLVTPLDVHQTFIDLLTYSKLRRLGGISREKINNPNASSLSIFSPIPPSRTCNDAGIIKAFCACDLKLVSVSTKDERLLNAALYYVDQINVMLAQSAENKCANLTLNRKLISAKTLINSKTNKIELHQLVFETLPGNANFEAMLSFNESGDTFYEAFSTSVKLDIFAGSLERINVYRDDSWCTENRKIQPFCYCGDPKPVY